MDCLILTFFVCCPLQSQYGQIMPKLMVGQYKKRLDKERHHSLLKVMGKVYFALIA